MSSSLMSVKCSAYNGQIALPPRPQLKVGILSDIQYANMDDAVLECGSKRFYRNALTCVERAVSSWTLQNVDCVVNLGDTIDAHNMVTDTTEQALQAVLDVFNKLPDHVEVLHALGNHCVCHPLERECLLRTLRLTSKNQANELDAPENGFYSYVPSDDWKLIVLDACDISTYAWDKDHPNFREAYGILTRHSDVELLPDNSSFRKLLKAKQNEKIKERDFMGNLEGLNQRFVFYNGAVGREQLEWFERELEDAKAAEQNVLVFCHMPVLPGICKPSLLLWNYDEVLDTMHRFRNNVKGVFCGHAHRFGFKRDKEGIPHMVLPAVLETPPGLEGHGMITAFNDKIIVTGFNQKQIVWNLETERKKTLGTFNAEDLKPAGVH